jgi:chromosome segregation ATPase
MEVQENVNKNVFSLEEATASYVKQLEARKSQIADNISSDEEIIAIKEEKIKNLRSEIADYRNSIKDLNTENDNIDTKI